MTEELQETAKEVKNRVFRSRFFGSFAIAFVAINWRAIYVLLFPSADLGFLDRMDWIDGNLYDVRWVNSLKLLLGPLVYACFNVALLPRFINWLEEYGYRASIDHRNARERIDERLRHKQLEIASVKGMLTNEKEQTNKMQVRINEMEKILGASDGRNREVGEIVRDFIRLDRVLRLNLEDIARDPNVRVHPTDLSLLKAAGLIDMDGLLRDRVLRLSDAGTKMLVASPIPDRSATNDTVR